jgi:hypothetical protein
MRFLLPDTSRAMQWASKRQGLVKQRDLSMLFISHSSKDKAEANKLHALLLGKGYDPAQLFLDSDERSGIEAGAQWEQVLYQRLKDCQALLVLCSPNWKASQWCFAEYVYAKMSGKEIFPIVIADGDIGSVASEYQAVFVAAEKIIPKDSLPPDVEAAVRSSFVKYLAQVNDKDEFVRLTARWHDLPELARPILSRFIDERLLVKSERDGQVLVEVAHEAMFRCWDMIRDWLRTSADILRWKRDVERDQKSDQQSGRRWNGLRPARISLWL